MIKEPFQGYSKLAFRGAAYTTLLLFLFGGSFVFLFPDYVLNNLFVAALVFAAGSFCINYVVFNWLHFKRLQKLHQIIEDISQKIFGSYQKANSREKDELDHIILRAIQASEVTGQEIERLNHLENYRKEFIGDISHELKTPIFAIQGFIETLLNGAIEDEKVNRKFLKKAMRNIDRLIYLTRDLMEISKLETGRLNSELQNVNLFAIISEVVENLQYKARKGNVTLTLNYFDKNIDVRADRNQLKQALINLIENAIKYNKVEGNVTVGAETWIADDKRMRVFVRDTGIGMEQQYIERVTERFFRIDKSRSRERGGTGLGLAIVKHILKAHGEQFMIESTPEVGSVFSFTLQKAKSLHK